MEEDTFICAVCKETYIKNRTDEEANKEAETIFGVANTSKNSECGVVCDDCWTYNMNRPEIQKQIFY